MELGVFSVSLNVKDIAASVVFYERLGFRIIDGGHINEGFKDSDNIKWRFLEHPSIKIGLFQGMFDENILTFNPKTVLKIQRELKSKGIALLKETSEEDSWKAIIFCDPDGNQIMLDQQ